MILETNYSIKFKRVVNCSALFALKSDIS